MTEAKRRLAAILAADVYGYSRLMGVDEEGTVAALNERRTVFRDTIEAFTGRTVDTAGDSVLATFDSIVEAVRAAVKIQETIAELNESLPDSRRMHFRIGLNAGDIVEQSDGTIYGDGVNIAARLESLAEPGGIVVSEDAYRNVRNRIDLGFEDIGSHQVKNISEPVRAFRIVAGEGQAVVASPEATARSRRKLLVIGVATAVFAGLVAWQSLTSLEWGRDLRSAQEAADAAPDPELAPADGPAIAVLPFDNLSGDPEQDYFADGIADTLITDLSKLWNLGVIARHSTFAYKGQSVDVREVGAALGATHVLQGSVLRAASEVRVNVQLIDAVSGEQIWADRFDGPIDDIFAVQDQIVGDVISELDIQLVGGEQARVWRRSTDNPDAYDIFLRAREIQYGRSEADTAQAQRLLESAIELDESFAAAIVVLGNTHYDQAVAGWSESPDDSLTTAEQLFRRAIELDDSLGAAHGSLGIVYLVRQDYEKALEHAALAVEKTPGAAASLATASIIYTYAGKAALGLEMIERATRLDPIPEPWFAHVRGAAHIFLGDHDAALAEYRGCLEQLPGFVWCSVNIIIPSMELGMIDEAKAQAQEVRRNFPDFDSETAVQVTRIKDPAIRDHWRSLLRQAGLP